MYLKPLHLVINYALNIENPSYAAQTRLKNIKFYCLLTSQLFSNLTFKGAAFPAHGLYGTKHRSNMAQAQLRYECSHLFGRQEEGGIRESALSLPHCHFFKRCIILSKSLTSVGL